MDNEKLSEYLNNASLNELCYLMSSIQKRIENQNSNLHVIAILLDEDDYRDYHIIDKIKQLIEMGEGTTYNNMSFSMIAKIVLSGNDDLARIILDNYKKD